MAKASSGQNMISCTNTSTVFKLLKSFHRQYSIAFPSFLFFFFSWTTDIKYFLSWIIAATYADMSKSEGSQKCSFLVKLVKGVVLYGTGMKI